MVRRYWLAIAGTVKSGSRIKLGIDSGLILAGSRPRNSQLVRFLNKSTPHHAYRTGRHLIFAAICDVEALEDAWRWNPSIGPAPSSLGGTAQTNGDPILARYKNEATPIMANGVLYESAGTQRVVAAIDAATGKQLWLWEGMGENGRDRKAPRRNAGRGVGYWTDGREEWIFVITTGFYLVALNAKTAGLATRTAAIPYPAGRF
jgi:hypothetical protein